MTTFGTAAMCAAFRWPIDQARRYRLAGFFDGVGTRSGKTWQYTAPEVVEVGLADFLRRSGFGLRRAFATAHASAPQIRLALSSASTGDVIVRLPLDLDRPYGPCDEGPAAEETAVAMLVVNLNELGRRTLARVEAAQRSAT